MANIHFIMQGKGGVGKSLSASFLAQFKRDQGFTIKCYDTDPVNQTFSAITGLNVQHLPILEENEINTRIFDQLIEELITINDEDIEVVIDNGAATFVPLSTYMVENDIVELLEEKGHKVFIHVIVVGGQGYRDTINGFGSVARNFPSATLVVWENPFLGALGNANKPFRETEIYNSNKERVYGVIVLPKKRQETFGKDIEDMLGKHNTFTEISESDTHTIMVKQRIKRFSEEVFAAIRSASL